MDSQEYQMSHIHAFHKEIETLKKPLARLHDTAPPAASYVNEVSNDTQSPGEDEYEFWQMQNTQYSGLNTKCNSTPSILPTASNDCSLHQ